MLGETIHNNALIPLPIDCFIHLFVISRNPYENQTRRFELKIKRLGIGELEFFSLGKFEPLKSEQCIFEPFF